MSVLITEKYDSIPQLHASKRARQAGIHLLPKIVFIQALSFSDTRDTLQDEEDLETFMMLSKVFLVF